MNGPHGDNCFYCLAPKDEHVEGKCLFGTNDYMEHREMNMSDPKTINDLFVNTVMSRTGDEVAALEAAFLAEGSVDYWLKRCKNCQGRKDTGHVEGKCLFQPTEFLAFSEGEARQLASENTTSISQMLHDQLKSTYFVR